MSSCLYAAAGLLWNLEAHPAGKPTLGFLRPDRPNPPTARQVRASLAKVALPPIAFAAAVLLLSVRWRVFD